MGLILITTTIIEIIEDSNIDSYIETEWFIIKLKYDTIKKKIRRGKL